MYSVPSSYEHSHTEQCSVRIRASKHPFMLSSPVKVADGQSPGSACAGYSTLNRKKRTNNNWQKHRLAGLPSEVGALHIKRKRKKSTPFCLLWRTTANNNDNYMVIVAALRMGLRSATDLPPLGKSQLIIVIYHGGERRTGIYSILSLLLGWLTQKPGLYLCTSYSVRSTR